MAADSPVRRPANVGELQTRLGYVFRNQDLLRRALTHKSRAYEGGQASGADNERLEFLGDSILGFLASEWLIARFPEESEGRLSKLKAHLVSATHLATAAQNLELGNYLILGRGEELSGGRAKRALLADAFEAVIAAVYLDGSMEAARELVEKFLLSGFDLVQAEAGGVFDFKGALQELTRTLKLPLPQYLVVEESGPEHAKTFLVEARVGREWMAQGQGSSKKSAAQQAARLIWKQLSSRKTALG